MIDGVSGIAQRAANGDPLGIVAEALEVAAAVAGGLISTNSLVGNGLGDVLKVAQGIQLYAGIGSTAASVANAFKNGDLAGSLSALLPLVAQEFLRSGEVGVTTGQGNASVKNVPTTDLSNGQANAGIIQAATDRRAYLIQLGIDPGSYTVAQIGDQRQYHDQFERGERQFYEDQGFVITPSVGF